MRSRTIAFLVGISLFQTLPTLPPASAAVGILLALGATLGMVSRASHASVTLVAALSAGFAWSWGAAALRLGEGLSADLQGIDLVVVGQIVDLPRREGRRLRFRLQPERLRLPDGRSVAAPGGLRLAWYGRYPPLTPGERWRLRVRLKRPHGFMSPGGFDFERWLFREGIRATGYVRDDPRNRRLASTAWSLDRVRDETAARLAGALEGGSTTGLLQALAVGDRRGVSDRQWQVLSATGTTHLMAISGLHIGLVAGLAFLAARWLWSRCCRCTLRLPAARAAAVAALVAAALYAALAGFSVPTQRALVMTAVALAALLGGRHAAAGRTLAVALAAVLLLDPLAVLSLGFWLSFAAVAVILFASANRIGRTGRLAGWIRVQGVVTLGLTPLLLIGFGEASLSAPLVNLLAVPWVGLLVVPPLLAGALLLPISMTLAEPLLLVAEAAMAALWWVLERSAAVGPMTAHAPLWLLLPAIPATLLLLAPRGVPGRWLASLGLLPLLLYRPPGIPPGAAQVTVLDVGQGLSAVVRTARHTLVFDTGPRFSASFDAGEAVLVPFLRASGVERIDRLVLSHGDDDHVGGLDALRRAYTVAEILGSEVGDLPCNGRWQWDGVTFEFLHPVSDARLGGNNDSCVLVVRAAGRSVLLTGDIEVEAERQLLQRERGKLRADVVVAPHHGSATSSSEPFVAAVAPRWVLYSTGYRNRFGFPNEEVAARYRRAGAEALDTAEAGAIRVRLDSGGRIDVTGFREVAGHYWNGP